MTNHKPVYDTIKNDLRPSVKASDFVLFARKNKPLTKEEAFAMIAQWKEQWPEIVEFFKQHIEEETK